MPIIHYITFLFEKYLSNVMWKKLIWSGATFVGGSLLIWSNNENADTGFHEDTGYSCWPFTQNKTSKYWNLLKSSKSKNQNVRHQAIKSLAELTNLEEWQYKIIANGCDPRAAVGLARHPEISISVLLSPSVTDSKETNSKEDFYKLITSLPLANTDLCVKLLTERAKSLAHQLLKEQQEWNTEPEDSITLFHSERRRKEELMFDKVSLQAISGLSSVQSYRLEMLEKGVLKFLEGILKHHKCDTEFQSLIAQILANIALEKESLTHLHESGWIGTLASWSKSSSVSVNLPAIKALANLDLDDFHYAKYENGVYLLHPSYRQARNKEYHADVIFVHGLLGATFWTWRQHDSMKEYKKEENKLPDSNKQPNSKIYPQYTYCWPKDWLPTDFPNARIISVDYNSSVSKWKAECPQQEEKDSIDAKANTLMEKLLLSNVGEKPIIWITHSMGGLLVKQLLLQSSLSNNVKVNSISKKTTGVIFFSVPHFGSDLVNIFQSVPYIFQPSIDMGHLQKGSTKLLSLHDSFEEIVDKNNIAVLSFGETRKSKWGLTLSMLVSEDSSDPGFGEFHGLPADHLSTCKPESPDSFVYTKIVNFLHSSIPQHLQSPQRFSKLEYEVSNILCLIP
ncbi:hypothetical protein JTE90_023850 [Oedothorax gibbosus]|uniref:Protein SERAC1 n=1 Tax=Oedothorax gibbosus TaxID=931172 RepID=A0AAV6VJS8_9ARAC|nr:hypothetical protein JTE90_023850 [Oedothorax gibbosus]